MGREADTAIRYRIRAEEPRAIARAGERPGKRSALLGVAVDYELMGETMEAIERSNQNLEK